MENQSQRKQQTPILCLTGCGFYGSSATENLCSKCFKDSIDNTSNSSNADHPSTSNVILPPVVNEASTTSSSATVTLAATVNRDDPTSTITATSDLTTICDSSISGCSSTTTDVAASSKGVSSQSKELSRCKMCNKRVGLTGFTCRCGGLFCAEHRYDDAHKCTYDYKAVEREELRKKNPVVVSDKIQQI